MIARAFIRVLPAGGGRWLAWCVYRGKVTPRGPWGPAKPIVSDRLVAGPRFTAGSERDAWAAAYRAAGRPELVLLSEL